MIYITTWPSSRNICNHFSLMVMEVTEVGDFSKLFECYWPSAFTHTKLLGESGGSSDSLSRHSIPRCLFVLPIWFFIPHLFFTVPTTNTFWTAAGPAFQGDSSFRQKDQWVLRTPDLGDTIRASSPFSLLTARSPFHTCQMKARFCLLRASHRSRRGNSYLFSQSQVTGVTSHHIFSHFTHLCPPYLQSNLIKRK